MQAGRFSLFTERVTPKDMLYFKFGLLLAFFTIIFNVHHLAFDVKICTIMEPQATINFKVINSFSCQP